MTSIAQRVRTRTVDAASAVPEAEDEVARRTSEAAATAERVYDSC